MKKNVCGADRIARAGLGVYLLAYLLQSRRRREGTRSFSARELLLVYGIAELSVNVFAQWCPLNALFQIDSCSEN